MTGLVSVSFREFSPDQIIEMVKKAGLDGIEWGGDIHVPAGNIATATRIGELTRAAGLQVLSYGSYAFLGDDDAIEQFEAVCASAKALGAPVIRIWAGREVYDGASTDEYLATCAQQWKTMCQMAGDIVIASEYHRSTLTETITGARLLLDATKPCDNRATYWQPNPDLPSEDDFTNEIAILAQDISYVHVFHWPKGVRRPLEEGAALWHQRIAQLEQVKNHPRAYLLEFIMDDSEEQFFHDAQTLKRLVQG